MAFIDVIEPAVAEGELQAIYTSLEKSRGKIAEVHKIQSLNPESITRHMDLYMTIMFGKSPLRRWQREMIAVVVSAANRCPYCIRHHAEALNHYWKDSEKTDQLASDYRRLTLEPLEMTLCEFAHALTLDPSGQKDGSLVTRLKENGLSDRGILDAGLVIGYFNFVNRMVLGMGVGLEADPGGYVY